MKKIRLLVTGLVAMTSVAMAQSETNWNFELLKDGPVRYVRVTEKTIDTNNVIRLEFSVDGQSWHELADIGKMQRGTGELRKFSFPVKFDRADFRMNNRPVGKKAVKELKGDTRSFNGSSKPKMKGRPLSPKEREKRGKPVIPAPPPPPVAMIDDEDEEYVPGLVRRCQPGLVAPVEIPVSARPASENIRSNGTVSAYIGDESVTFWNDAGKLKSISGVVTGAQANTFELVQDRIVADGYVIFPGAKLSNYVREYRLDGYVDGVPSSAVKVFEKFYGDNARWVRSLRTDKGGIVTAGFSYFGAYNNTIAYRSPSGEWSFYRQVYGSVSMLIPAFDFELHQGRDGRIYIFIGRDSSHTIALARWSETTDGKLKFDDFRYDFLVNECSYIFDRTVCRDGSMAPDYENPPVRGVRTADGAIYLTYPTSVDSKAGCWWRLANPVVTRIDTIPQPPHPRILRADFAPSILYVTFQSIPGVAYMVQVTDNLNHWDTIKNLDDGQVDIVATNATTTIRCFHYSEKATMRHETNLFCRVIALSYKRTLEFADTRDFVERSFGVTAIMQNGTNGLLYYPKPMDEARDCIEVLHLRNHDLQTGFETEIPVNYNLNAWGGQWIIGSRSNSYFIRKQ